MFVARFASVGLLLAALAAMAEQEPPPNFIFILADDLGWGDAMVYGNSVIATPNIDQLASDGTLFTQFYVASPICSPSRAAFMTGRFPAEVGVHTFFGSLAHNKQYGMGNALDPAIPTVTSALHDAGYKTAHFGKWHLSASSSTSPPPDTPDPGAYGIDDHITEGSVGPHFPREPDPEFFWARSSTLIIDETIRFIEKHQTEPFYINAWLLLPHSILNPTAEQAAQYAQHAPPGVPERGATQIYAASVTDLDTQIGRLLLRLDELELADNTVVIFASDNGPEVVELRVAGHSAAGSPGPFRGVKRSLYEGGIRSPFIVRWPNQIPAGRVDNASIIAAVDILPTVAELAGIKLPPDLQLDGEDVSAVLQGAPQAEREALFWESRFAVTGKTIHRSPRLAIRSGNLKLLMNPDGSRIEMYDLLKDPTEVDNIADSYMHSQRKPELVHELINWHLSLPAGYVNPSAGGNFYPWP
ncbi:MAG: sulfatase-like hydrolase/transferase [Gammaproteobacteria bacterium]|nr:sulfatase-like hydrolase/transferase [Gammaproteobacteria bacterium]